MPMEKVKIVVDADVIIHFSKGERLYLLPDILSEYDFVVLHIVRNELLGPIRQELDRQETLLKNITTIEFDPPGEMLHEYMALTAAFGKGESACMAYCRFTNNVIGSSNLTDIKDYCHEHQITYLTTLDFLYYAIQRGKMTIQECNEFIQLVRSKDSKLPNIDIAQYIPSVQL